MKRSDINVVCSFLEDLSVIIEVFQKKLHHTKQKEKEINIFKFTLNFVNFWNNLKVALNQKLQLL